MVFTSSSGPRGMLLEMYLDHVANAPVDLAHHPVVSAGDFNVCLAVQATRPRGGDCIPCCSETST